MLITGSPFPPYAPVDVNVYAKPDLRTKGGWRFAHDAATNASVYVWTKGAWYHRLDDLPAYVTTRGSYTFYVDDIRHRVNGVAECKVDSNKIREKRFFLYGHHLTEAGFKRTHQLAIYHKLPLWVIVFGEVFKKDTGMSVGNFAVEAKQLLEAFPNVDVDWMTKLWNVTDDGVRGVSSQQLSPKHFLHNLKRVIEAEKTEQHSLVGAI